MAKFDSILGLRGTFQQITFVKSKAYGYHVRAARGTHKKAEVNQALKDSAERLASGNVPAKILRDAFAIYYPDLKGSLLWRRLLRLFRKQLKATGSIDFTKITAFEIHAAHPLNCFIAAQYQISLDTTARELL